MNKKSQSNVKDMSNIEPGANQPARDHMMPSSREFNVKERAIKDVRESFKTLRKSFREQMAK